jgi:hypothetical protein
LISALTRTTTELIYDEEAIEEAEKQLEKPRRMNEEAKKIAALTKERNKEYSVVRNLGDLYVNLLRCSRSPDHLYRVEAADSLVDFLDTLALEPKTPLMEIVDRASHRVGWQKEPDSEYDKALDGICRAAITYMIEASGYNKRRLLTKRKTELVRRIDHFNNLRGDRRKVKQPFCP